MGARLTSQRPEPQRVERPACLARETQAAGRAVVETGYIAECRAPVRPCQLRQARRRGRADRSRMGPGGGHLCAGPLGLAQRTSDPHGEHRVRKRDETRGWHSPVSRPLRHRMARGRAGWRGPRQAVQATIACVPARWPPTHARSDARRSRRRRRRHAGTTHSHPLAARRGAHGPATWTRSPSARRSRPARTATGLRRTTPTPRPFVRGLRAAGRRRALHRLLRARGPGAPRAGGSAQQPFSGRMTPGAGEALALADGTPHLGTTRSQLGH